MINEYKIHRMVEYIKLSDFEFETEEVTESLENVLSHYGLAEVDLTDEEYQSLIAELLPLAEKFEFREVEHLAFQDDFFSEI